MINGCKDVCLCVSDSKNPNIIPHMSERNFVAVDFESEKAAIIFPFQSVLLKSVDQYWNGFYFAENPIF